MESAGFHGWRTEGGETLFILNRRSVRIGDVTASTAEFNKDGGGSMASAPVESWEPEWLVSWLGTVRDLGCEGLNEDGFQSLAEVFP